jgi:hypothetical protein
VVSGTFHVTDDRDVWVGTREPDGGDRGVFVRHAGTGDWVAERPGVNRTVPSTLTVEPGGTAWVGGVGMGWLFGHRDENGWTVRDEGYPDLGTPAFGRSLSVASPDASLWLAPAWTYGCGLLRLEASALPGLPRFSTFLSDTCFYALDIAPDGTVWAFGKPWHGPAIGLYAITPEAVAMAPAFGGDPPVAIVTRPSPEPPSDL